MSPRLEHFLKEKGFLTHTDWGELNNWSDETTKAKFARREVPTFIRVKNLKLIRYEDAAEYLLKQGRKEVTSQSGEAIAMADLLGASPLK